MNLKDIYKLVVFVPKANADELRQAMGDAGGGAVGKYSHCSFTSEGTGRFTPGEGAKPAIGEVGKPEQVLEERIETVCEKDKLEEVLEAIRKVHPYEEPATEIYEIKVVE